MPIPPDYQGPLETLHFIHLCIPKGPLPTNSPILQDSVLTSSEASLVPPRGTCHPIRSHSSSSLRFHTSSCLCCIPTLKWMLCNDGAEHETGGQKTWVSVLALPLISHMTLRPITSLSLALSCLTGSNGVDLDTYLSCLLGLL